MPLWRGNRQYVYHNCAVCGLRQPIEKMRWQHGVLKCYPSGCVDTASVGSRDVAVAKAVSIDRQEMTPDRKLVEPSARTVDQEDVLY